MQVSISNLWKLKKLLCYYFLINFVCLCLIFEKQKDSNKKRFQLFFPYFVSHLISEKTSHSIIYRFKFKIELSRLYGPKAWSAILQWLCFINNINMLKTHLVWCKFIDTSLNLITYTYMYLKFVCINFTCKNISNHQTDYDHDLCTFINIYLQFL